jgi:predicted permease
MNSATLRRRVQMRNFWIDVRHSLRALRKAPGFAAVAVLTLSLGIGANTAIFSLVNSALLRPLPVKDPAQITLIGVSRDLGPFSMNISYPVLQDLLNQTNSPFSDIIAFQYGADGLTIDGKGYSAFTNYVTGNYFEMLGVKPALGRLFLPTEGAVPGADPVIVLSYSLWQARFGGDPAMVGKKILVDGHPFTVIGITPRGFHGLTPILDVRAYIPFAEHLALEPEIMANGRNPLTDRSIQNLHVYGRLKPGVTAREAAAALGTLAPQIAKLEPQSEKSLKFRVVPELQARPDPDSYTQLHAAAGLFLGLAGFVLVLACMNVANILLVRANLRRREMAIRAALGGTRRRIARLLLTESLILALAGGAGGILAGEWLSNAVSNINLGTTLPIVLDFSFDWRVFSYAFAAALLTGILVGIVPAFRASRTNLMEVLHESGRAVAVGKQRFRSTLVVAQVAGSLILLIMAGLFMRSMRAAESVDIGFDPTHVANISMDIHGLGYNEQQGLVFVKNLLARTQSLPGVVSAGVASTVPFGYYSDAARLQIDGYTPPPNASSRPYAMTSAITPDYLRTMKITFFRGRNFQDSDTATSERVAVINEAMAKEFWPNQDPLGRQFEDASKPKIPIRVVGIVRDFRYDNFSGPVGPLYFTAMLQDFSPLQTLHVRTTGDPAGMIPALQSELVKLAPGLALFDVGTMTQAMNTLNGLLLFQLAAGIAAALGLLGLVLAIVGVYGIVSYVTGQRTNEIGIRMAMGADPPRILKMVLRQGLVIVLIGLALGLAGAAGAGHLAAGFLVNVSPTDPLTYFAVASILTFIALLACFIPAWRATKVDPMVALRYE